MLALTMLHKVWSVSGRVLRIFEFSPLSGSASDQAGPTEHHMHKFLSHNREELIARCKAKVAQRPRRDATEAQLANGVPLFLEQLMRTLEAQKDGDLGESLRISGAAG